VLYEEITYRARWREAGMEFGGNFPAVRTRMSRGRMLLSAAGKRSGHSKVGVWKCASRQGMRAGISPADAVDDDGRLDTTSSDFSNPLARWAHWGCFCQPKYGSVSQMESDRSVYPWFSLLPDGLPKFNDYGQSPRIPLSHFKA